MITIKIDNDNFGSDSNLSRMLRELANRIDRGQEPTKVMDINGNSVGEVIYENVKLKNITFNENTLLAKANILLEDKQPEYRGF